MDVLAIIGQKFSATGTFFLSFLWACYQSMCKKKPKKTTVAVTWVKKTVPGNRFIKRISVKKKLPAGTEQKPM